MMYTIKIQVTGILGSVIPYKYYISHVFINNKQNIITFPNNKKKTLHSLILTNKEECCKETLVISI